MNQCQSQDSTHTDFEIDLGFIYYIFEKGPVACYISPQFGVGFGSGEFYYGSTKFEESTSMFYIGCSIGCEWWFTDGLSLSVRTFLGFESNKDKIEAPSYEQEKTNTVFGIIGDKGPNFSINFYF